MSKIDVLPNQAWGADAALHSALEEIKPTDKVLIIGLVEDENGNVERVYRAANFTQGEVLFEMERRKVAMFVGEDE